MSETRFFEGKVVVITGGSKGLGLAMAREFGGKGARLVLLARHADELAEAQDSLRGHGIDAVGRACDVSNQGQVESLLDEVQASYGRIDILVNNAGTVQIGPVDTMTVDDIRTAVDTMLWGTVYATMKVLPAMRARNEGRIVNITSIGGKVSVPHLLPYNTAKFGAVGFSEGLQAELGSTGVKVVTVVPGLMRTGSYLNAMVHGETQQEYRWFTLASSVPVLTISAESAARRIVRATEKGEAEVILTLPANALARFKGVLPGVTQHVLTLSQRFLPRSTGEKGSKSGRDVKHSLNERSMVNRLHARAMTLGTRAADRLQPSRNR